MEVVVTKEKNRLEAVISGEIDTLTAPQLESYLADAKNFGEVILDFKNVSYISSAGLRVLLAVKRSISKSAVMKVINVNEDVYSIFELTGFSGILDIQK